VFPPFWRHNTATLHSRVRIRPRAGLAPNEFAMPDDKIDDKYQRSFEIEYVAKINGITKRQAADLIKKYGNDYAAIAREAKWLQD